MDTPGDAGHFGTGWRGEGGDQGSDQGFESVHDAPIGAEHGSALHDALHDVQPHELHGLADAAAGIFHFDPVEMDSHDDYDFNGDGHVDHHDARAALHGLHDFHVHEPDPAHDLAHDPAHDIGFFHH